MWSRPATTRRCSPTSALTWNAGCVGKSRCTSSCAPVTAGCTTSTVRTWVDRHRSPCPSTCIASTARRSSSRTASPRKSSGPPAERRLRLARRTHRDSQPVAQGTLRGGAGPRRRFYTLGSATLVLIILQLITGIFLTLLFVPSVTEAWQSLNYLKEHDAFGSIVRGIHLWSAYILLFVIGLHMVRTFFSGSYKRPRELNWVTGVGLFVLVLGMAITGAFLPWDQAAYWTAVVVTNIPVYTPFIGSFIRALWRGADTVGPITLSRTFGIHGWLLPAILFPLIGAHLALLRKHGGFGSYTHQL